MTSELIHELGKARTAVRKGDTSKRALPATSGKDSKVGCKAIVTACVVPHGRIQMVSMHPVTYFHFPRMFQRKCVCTCDLLSVRLQPIQATFLFRLWQDSWPRVTENAYNMTAYDDCCIAVYDVSDFFMGGADLGRVYDPAVSGSASPSPPQRWRIHVPWDTVCGSGVGGAGVGAFQ